MSLQSKYARSIRRELKHHPVWEPGTPAEIGDYGIIADGCFRKLGHLRDFDVQVRQAASLPVFFEFASNGVTIGGVTSSVGGSTASADEETTIEIKFGDANSLFLRARQATWERVDNLHEVETHLAMLPGWKPKWKFITVLQRAKSFVLLSNSKKNASISISGRTAALESVKMGVAVAEAELRITGDVALKVIGRGGPLLMELAQMQKGILGDRLKFALPGNFQSSEQLIEIVAAAEEIVNDE